MSYTTAKAQLIVMVGTHAVPVMKTLGLGTRFVHCPTAARDKMPAGRSFWMKTQSGSRKGPLVKQTQRYTADVDLHVWYPGTVREHDLDLVIQSDYKVIVDVFMDDSKYDAANSKLVNVANGADFFAPYKVEEVDEGDLLVISFPMVYRD